LRIVCKQTGSPFTVSDKDLAFYEKISPLIGQHKLVVPPPSLSPEARQRRRLTFRNERTLYRRKCDLSGQAILSTYAMDAPMPVYNHKAWFSDCWDPMRYGQSFDFNRTFFEQFQELLKAVPMFSLHHQVDNENCDFTNLVSRNKNSYFIFAALENEDCFYSTYLHHCTDIDDCYFVFNCELCYECIDCYDCYSVKYSQRCNNCNESDYLIECKGCSNCFGCVSLANKKYCIFNQTFSKDQYEKIVQEILSRPDKETYIAKHLRKLTQEVGLKYYSGLNNENAVGDHISNCKNVYYCFDCTNLEDCSYCTWLHYSKDCYDCYAWGSIGELGLENHLCGNNFFHLMFCDQCWGDVANLLYCKGCWGNCRNLFACAGLHHKEYCIFNVQYSKEDYEKLVPQIVSHMQKTKEWGEFFPEPLSPYGYNETVAQEYFPLTREQVANNGWNWRGAPLPGTFGQETASISDYQQEIGNIEDSVCEEIFACKNTAKNFRITTAELKLYKKLGVRLPESCFDERYMIRKNKRTDRKLHQRQCDNCETNIISTYDSSDTKRILCEDCHKQSAYA